MPPSPNTDNSAMSTKLALRRWLLDRTGITEVRVLDCCAGAGRIWTAMEDFTTIRLWTKIDVKPRDMFTLKMKAEQAVVALPLADYNVVDIDPYGEPWAAYRALLKRLTSRMLVFLTVGDFRGTISGAAIEVAGMPASWQPYLVRLDELTRLVSEINLRRTWDYAHIRQACKAELPHEHLKTHMIYYGLDLEPWSLVPGGKPAELGPTAEEILARR
jgi:hypothetical protein